MRQFGASQMMVQRAFQALKDRGVIESQVGRGTFFRGEAAARAGGRTGIESRPSGGEPSTVKSVLLLRRSVSIVRGRALVDGLQRRFSSDGHRVLELSYTDLAHAQTVLKGIPHFDACVVQSSFRTITIEFLASLRTKSSVIAIDGAGFDGSDVEAVGTEMGEPLAEAITLLQQQGHRRIAFACTSRPFLSGQLGQRRFEYLHRHLPDLDLQKIVVQQLPFEDYQEALVGAIKAAVGKSGRLPFSALVAWGIEDGASFRSLLANAGFEVPSSLSVVLLGRTDLANEHAEFFDTIGSRVADQIEEIYQAINARWADPSAPYALRLTPVSVRPGKSIQAPAKEDADLPPPARVRGKAKDNAEKGPRSLGLVR